MPTTLPHVAKRLSIALTTLSALACQSPAERAVSLQGNAAPSPSPTPADVELASRENGGGIPGPGSAIPEGLQDALKAYLDAYSRSDWPSVWGLTATTERESLIALGRHPAERSRDTARAQGFESSEQVRGITDEGWFTANRSALAKAGRLPKVPSAEGLRALDVTPVIVPGASSGRVSVAVSFVSDTGSRVVLGAVMQGSDWRFFSPRVSAR